ncbi:MAG: hypothetical protein FJ280_15495 [Planctomycetes bacterium]|nr:hypothetical protein [Planctomycetota bacterium]
MSSPMRCMLTGLVLTITSLVTAADPLPIRLHPENPHYFQWRGKALALITSAEHYGAVLNLDFDWRKYLETLERDGMNYTRIFVGSYVEPAGAFGIERNTLAPASGRFLAPWARSDTPGYAGGGNKFDLERFSPEYLARLKDFLTEAGRRGIVVEVTLFCSTYSDKQWAVHPFHPQNNLQAFAVPDWKKLHTRDNGPAMAYQERLVRRLVRDLNEFDNFFFEIQNEPWADNHVMGEVINPYLTDRYKWPNAVEVTTADSIAWQARIATIITEEESRLPQRHLIGQNVANFRLPARLDDLAPGISIVNFHYAYPEAATWNLPLGKVIGYDETGFAGRTDAVYRRQAWNFLFSGGGLFNGLDYSFTVGHEDGTDLTNQSPGGGSPTLRRQLKVLSEFLHSFDLAKLRPDRDFVKQSPGGVTRVLSAPGQAYALYLEGRAPVELSLDLPAGRWRAEWIDPVDGVVLQAQDLDHAGAIRRLTSPTFTESIALRIIRL